MAELTYFPSPNTRRLRDVTTNTEIVASLCVLSGLNSFCRRAAKCVYGYVYGFVCVCVRACARECVCLCMRAEFVCVCVCVHIRTVCVFMCVCVCLGMCAECVCVCSRAVCYVCVCFVYANILRSAWTCILCVRACMCDMC